MRVLHLIDHMGMGGAQKVVLDFLELHGPAFEARALSLRHSVLPEAEARMRAAGVPFRSAGVRRGNPFSLVGLRGAIRAERADILHTHLEFSGTFGTLAALSLGRDRPLIVNHIHNDPNQRFTLLHRQAGRFSARRVEAHVVATAGIEQAARECFGRIPGRLAVVPYGIDRAWADRARSARDDSLRRGARVVLGAVGRLVSQKAFHLAVQTLPRILALEPTTRLWIIGAGPLREALAREARDHGVADSVEFFGQRSDLAPFYDSMDLFVLPSRYEATSLALLEAMASGVPVVSTRIAGVADVIEDGVNGLLVPPGDAPSLASAIERLIRDESLRARLAESARATMLRNHTREMMIENLESLYRELISARRAAQS
ncbi:MAG: glycosyltransferase [Gemmatimonadetes bacterium]|nr:glycosyltransferase [Gemmatimonadota bacterium]